MELNALLATIEARGRGDKEKRMVAVLEMIRKCKCTQCEYEWWPKTPKPKKCPGCGSLKWNKPYTSNPSEINEIVIKGDVHSHYSYHYHIFLSPSFPQEAILPLLEDNLKKLLNIDYFNKERGYFEGKDYRVRDGRVEKRRIDDPRYFKSILKFTDTNHPHIFIEGNGGMELLINAINICFPKAKIQINDIDESEIKAKREKWHLMGNI